MRTPSSPALLSQRIGGSTEKLVGYEHIYGMSPKTQNPRQISEAVTKSGMLQDSNWINVQVHRLAKMFGVEKNNEVKILDISYPYLLKYAIEHTDGELHTWIQGINDIAVSKNGAIDEKAIDKLYEEAKTHLLEIKPEDEEQFKKIFVAMASNFTGEQRIKSLMILQRLIDEGITNASNYRGKRIMVRLGAERSVYNYMNHNLGVKNEKGYDRGVILEMEAKPNVEELTSMAATLTHEFSHAYHLMLGMYAPNVVNSLRVAALGNADFRKRLYPFLEKDISEAVARGIDGKFPNAPSANEVCAIIKDRLAGVYGFLKANDFFGNQNLDLGDLDDNFGEQAGYAKAVSVFIACFSLRGWDNGEEMLTISGILPVEFPIPESDDTHKYLIVDNQNESTFLTRDANAIRLFHSANDDLGEITGKNNDDRAERTSAILAVLSQIVQKEELFIQRSRKKMKKFSSSAIAMSSEDRTITTEEVTEAMEIMAASGQGSSKLYGDFLRSLIRDLADYAATLNLKLDPQCVVACIKNGVLVDSVLLGALKNSKKTLRELLEETLKTALSSIPTDEKQKVLVVMDAFVDSAIGTQNAKEMISSLISVVKELKFLEEFVEHYFGSYKGKIFLTNDDALDVLRAVLKNEDIPEKPKSKHISAILSYASKNKIEIEDRDLNEISQYLASVKGLYSDAITSLCQYALANNKEINMTEYTVKKMEKGYIISPVWLTKKYHSVVAIDVDECMKAAIESLYFPYEFIRQIYSYAQNRGKPFNIAKYTQLCIDLEWIVFVRDMFLLDALYERSDLNKCLEISAEYPDFSSKIIKYACKKNVGLDEELVQKSYSKTLEAASKMNEEEAKTELLKPWLEYTEKFGSGRPLTIHARGANPSVF
ncbi:MAG: hypothetical protein LBB63_04235 [Holosporaceae bacterium]|nr:hypothetical protein [Holosporaceae bacterium]